MADPIWYVCKYTPLEWIAGFGLPVQRLDPALVSFECADTCAHPNLCGYGKAVLEEVIGKGIRRLLLVDCCDVCRRIYDVLQERGGMEFLFLMSLPHKNGRAEQSLLEGELRRLSLALTALTGQTIDKEKMLDAWQQHHQAAGNTVPDAPHILLTGAHGGALLLETLQQSATLPVIDNTCTGCRSLSAPDPANMEALRLDYAGSLLNQKKLCMRMQFRQDGADPQAVGVICHTVKFCDYYGFQYRELKKNANQPLLKIETDCTPQSSGQLRTRIEAFSKTLEVKKAVMTNRYRDADYVAGVDSGSASTDAVILNKDGKIVGSAILPTGAGAAAGAEKALAAAMENAHLTREAIGYVVATGYGRETIGTGNASITEITCHAKGAHHLSPQTRTVIDIGGQDSKVILMDENGRVVNFVMNDKCAAGTGRFLDMMVRTMELTLPQMSEKGLHWKHEVIISSMCTVFAESEVVSLIAENTAPEDIIHGLNLSVAARIVSLVRRSNGKGPYIMTGGVAQNAGVVQALREKLSENILVPKEAQLCGALGAALFALEASGKQRKCGV